MTSDRLRILVIEDDDDQRITLRRALERHGCDVTDAATGVRALCAAVATDIDIALVDIHLPDMSGLELLGRLRDIVPGAHLVVVSAASSEGDLLRGFRAGADDYVVKPYSLMEVVARVNAIGRRRAQAPSPTADVLRLDDLAIDLRARSVWRGKVEVDLTRLEFDLLAHLAGHRGQAFSRQQLLETVWSSSADWQSTATVTEHIRRLRIKLELDPTTPLLIETVSRIGYRIPAPAVRETAVTASPIAAAASPIVAATNDAMAVVEGTTIIFATEALAALAGLPDAAAVVGHDVFDFIAPTSVDATRARHESVRDGHWPRPEVLMLRTAGGQDVEVELTSTPVVFRGVVASQITMWPVAAASLRQRATGISTEVPDAIVISNAEFLVQSFNRAAEELYGWTEAEVIGRNVLEVAGWEGTVEELDAAAARLLTAGRWHGEVTQRRRDGSTVVVAATTTLIRDSDGAVVGVISVNRPLASGVVRAAEIDEADGELVADIRRGLANGEFEVHYQPIVDLVHGSVVAVESLVRWRHPARGMLAPIAFIDAAESSGAIVELGRFVVETACEQAAQWRAAGHDLGVGVNISTRQLGDDGLVDWVDALMTRTGMTPGSLWLEVTETALVEDLDRAEAVLKQLEALGAHVAIDDFGTGWASLTYLHQFPVHALKIDRMFVDGLGFSTNDTAIVRSILSLGSELGLDVVGEGVETEEQLSHLRSLGCVMAQGYLFGRPVPADEVDLSRCPPLATAGLDRRVAAHR